MGARPVTVLDKDGALVDRFEFDNNATTTDTITIPLASRTEVIGLLKEYHSFSPVDVTSRCAVRLGNCQRYVSPTAGQWFEPA